MDGLDELINGGCQEQLESIRQQLQKGVQIGIISKSFPAEVVSATGNWLQHPIVRAATDKSVPASSVCITQSVSVVTTEEAKLSKVILMVTMFSILIVKANTLAFLDISFIFNVVLATRSQRE